MSEMRFVRSTTVSVALALTILSAILGVAYARQAQYHPVSLNRGTLNGYLWTVEVTRDSGKQGGQRPCLVISDLDTRGPSEGDFSGYTKTCSTLPSNGPPHILSATVGEDSRELSVFGIAFAPQLASAYMDFGSSGHMRVRLKPLNSVQRRNAGVRPLRYLALALKGTPCLRQVRGFNANGTEIYSGPIDECPESGK